MVAFEDLSVTQREFRYNPPDASRLQCQNDASLRWQASQVPPMLGGIKDTEYSTPYFQYGSNDYDVKYKALELKPVVKEMVRTRVTVPDVLLLVNKINLVRVATPHDSAVLHAYRLWMTDTEKTIQAVFKRRIHKEIVNLEIREGSIIALKEYYLATGPKKNGNGKVEYLAISDFKWMGEQRRFEFFDVEHESFGTIKRRPAESWDSVVHPESGHRSGWMDENEKWRMKYHHPTTQGEQYRVTHSRLGDPRPNDDSLDYLSDCDVGDVEETVLTTRGNPVSIPPNFDAEKPPLDEDDMVVRAKVDGSRTLEGIFEEDSTEDAMDIDIDDAPAAAPMIPDIANTPVISSDSVARRKRKRVSSASLSGASLSDVRAKKVLKKDHNIFESPDAGLRIASAASRLLGQHPGWLRRRVEETKMGRGPKDTIDLYSLTAVTHVLYDPRFDTSIIPSDTRIVRYNFAFAGATLESKWVVRITLNQDVCQEFGMTAEGVAMMLAYNHQNIRVIFTREVDKYPVVRVRQVIKEGDKGSAEQSKELAKLLMKTLLAKGPFFLDRTGRAYEHVPKEIAQKSETSGTATIFCSRESPWATKAIQNGTPLQPIDRPLNLSTLAELTGRNRSRNRVVDVLAKVDSVDDFTVKRTNMPLKRDIYITDDSTYQKVPLSIFTNPLDCIPEVGSLCLFRGVVTHDFRQGALNAYPKQCEGKDWCLPFPYAVEGHHAGLEQGIVRFLDDDDDRIILATQMRDIDRFHNSLSAKWPKHKRQRWKKKTTPQRRLDAEKMRRWNLVADPEICRHCEEPHSDLLHVRGTMKWQRRYNEWDVNDDMDCIRHEAVTDDESDDMGLEDEMEEEDYQVKTVPWVPLRDYIPG